MSVTTHRTMCPMNCHPTLCGMLVDVADGRVVGVRGDPDNPDSRGFLCIRGQASREILDNPRRLLHPLRRTPRSGTWQRIGWDEALDVIAARMQAVGREAVATWSGHGIFANNYGTRMHSHLLRRFSNLYGCQWWSPAIICWALGAYGLGLTGLIEANTKEDMGAHASLILLWGANLASQPNTARHLAAARRRGAGVVTIDVRETEASAQSDETLLIRPGTDAALALAMMRAIVDAGLADEAWCRAHADGYDELLARLRERTVEQWAATCGVPAEAIRRVAEGFARTQPALLRLGVGAQRHAGAPVAYRTIACLPALVGAWRHRGGGCSYIPTATAAAVDSSVLHGAELRDGPPPLAARRAALKKLKEAILVREDDFAAALNQDFGHRSKEESLLFDVASTVASINYLDRNVGRFMRPEVRDVAWVFWPAKNRVLYQPRGVVGIMSPWNYPLGLALIPPSLLPSRAPISNTANVCPVTGTKLPSLA